MLFSPYRNEQKHPAGEPLHQNDAVKVNRQKKAIQTLMDRIPEHRQLGFLYRMKADTERMSRGTSTPTLIPPETREANRNVAIVIGASLLSILAPQTLGHYTELHPAMTPFILLAGITGLLFSGVYLALRARHRRKNPRYHYDEDPDVIIEAIDDLTKEHSRQPKNHDM